MKLFYVNRSLFQKSISLLFLLLFLYSTVGFYFPSQHSHSFSEDIEAHHNESFGTELSHFNSEDHEVCTFKVWAFNLSQEILFVFDTSFFQYSNEKLLSLYKFIVSKTETNNTKSRAPPFLFI